MKFCKKCHRMKSGKLVNPNNLGKYCNCEGGMIISDDVLSRMRTRASGVVTMSLQR